MLTNTLPSTGDKNYRGEDSNTSESVGNVLTRNEYLNDQTINCSQTLRLDVDVDIVETRVGLDKNHDLQIMYSLT